MSLYVVGDFEESQVLKLVKLLFGPTSVESVERRKIFTSIINARFGIDQAPDSHVQSFSDSPTEIHREWWDSLEHVWNQNGPLDQDTERLSDIFGRRTDPIRKIKHEFDQILPMPFQVMSHGLANTTSMILKNKFPARPITNVKSFRQHILDYITEISFSNRIEVIYEVFLSFIFFGWISSKINCLINENNR